LSRLEGSNPGPSAYRAECRVVAAILPPCGPASTPSGQPQHGCREPQYPRNDWRTNLRTADIAVECEFGRFKNEWAMAPLRVRRIERVRLHVDPTALAKLAFRLVAERAVAVAA